MLSSGTLPNIGTKRGTATATATATRRAAGGGGGAVHPGERRHAHMVFGTACARRCCLLTRNRHYTVVLLVAVVALCTLENDVIHAGYLALALLFFRRRDELRLQRNRWGIARKL